MKSFVIFILLTLLTSSCSTVPFLEGFRGPASVKKFNCPDALRRILKRTQPERNLGQRMDQVEKALKAGEGEPLLRSLVSDLKEDTLASNDQALKDAWYGLYELHHAYGRQLEEGTSDFSPFLNDWKSLRKKFLQERGPNRRQALDKVQAARKELLGQTGRVLDDASYTSRPISDFPAGERKKKLFEYLSSKDFVEGRADFNSGQEESDFLFYLFKKDLLTSQESRPLKDFVEQELPKFQKAFKSMDKSEKKTLRDEGKKLVLDVYNQMVEKSVESLSGEGRLLSEAQVFLRAFSEIEPRFKHDEFLEWLLKNEKLSPRAIEETQALSRSEGFSLKLGDYLRYQYSRFAPFQDVPPVEDKGRLTRMKESVTKWWDLFKKETPECHSLECVSKKSHNGWLKIFKKKFYRESFSCLGQNPLVLKSLIMDVGLVWGAITWHYQSNKEDFQRFPYEIMLNGAIFAPLLAEANCRASFKGSLPFGTVIPQNEVLASGLTRAGRAFKHFRGIAFRGFLSSVGLLTMTAGIDHMLLAMGQSIAKPIGLNEMIVLLPMTYLFHGAWLGLKHLTFINPIRHKIIPRLAKAIEKKTRLKGSYWFIQTGFDFAAFKALLVYSQWEYLEVYQNYVLPSVVATFTAGVTLDEKTELKRDGTIEHSFEGKTEQGIETTVKIEEKDGEVKVEEVDVNATDDAIEAWADKILEGVEK